MFGKPLRCNDSVKRTLALKARRSEKNRKPYDDEDYVRQVTERDIPAFEPFLIVAFSFDVPL